MIPTFTNTYWDLCELLLYMPIFYFTYTSKSRLGCVHLFINNFMENFIPLFNSSFFQRIKIGYIRPWYTFCSRSLQIQISTGFKSGPFSGQWWCSNNQSCFWFFNIRRVTVWDLACFNEWILILSILSFNKYSDFNLEE